MQTIQDLLDSDIPSIKDMVTKAIHYKNKLDTQQITSEQFEELLEDLKSEKKIENEMSDLETMRLVFQALVVIDQIRHWSPF